METHLSSPSRFTSKAPTIPIISLFPHYESLLLSKANPFTCALDPFFACNKNLQLQRSFSHFSQSFLCIVTLSSLTLSTLHFLCPVSLFIVPYSPDTLRHSFSLIFTVNYRESRCLLDQISEHLLWPTSTFFTGSCHRLLAALWTSCIWVPA